MDSSLGLKALRFAGFVIPGYFNGKRDAEKKLATLFPTGGIALRPGFVYGTRQVGSFGIPLQAVGADSVLGYMQVLGIRVCVHIGASKWVNDFLTVFFTGTSIEVICSVLKYTRAGDGLPMLNLNVVRAFLLTG